MPYRPLDDELIKKYITQGINPYLPNPMEDVDLSEEVMVEPEGDDSDLTMNQEIIEQKAQEQFPEEAEPVDVRTKANIAANQQAAASQDLPPGQVMTPEDFDNKLYEDKPMLKPGGFDEQLARDKPMLAPDATENEFPESNPEDLAVFNDPAEDSPELAQELQNVEAELDQFPEPKEIPDADVSEDEPDVAGIQAEAAAEGVKEEFNPSEFEQPNKALDAMDAGDKQEKLPESIDDVKKYIMDKYQISPDVSYDELKKMQKRTGIMSAFSDFDTAIGGLGDWKLLQAKKGGYEGSYKGSALNKMAEREKQQFGERYKYQQEQLGREEGKIDFGSKTLGLFDKMKTAESMNNPKSLISKMYRQMAEKLGLEGVDENTPASALEKILEMSKKGSSYSPDMRSFRVFDKKTGKARWLSVDQKQPGYARDAITGEEFDPSEAEDRFVSTGEATRNPVTGEIEYPGAVIERGTPKSVDQMTLKEQVDQRIDESKYTKLKDQRQQFDTLFFSPKGLKTQINNLRGVKDSIEEAKAGNPLTKEQLKVQVAKVVLGEVGNLAAHDKDGMTESMALLDKAEQYINTLSSGNLTKTNLNFLDRIISRADTRLNKVLYNEYKGFKDRVSNQANISPYNVDRTYGTQVFSGTELEPQFRKSLEERKRAASQLEQPKQEATPSPEPGAKQDPDAVKAAELWNMPYDQAKRILDARKAKRSGQ